MKISKIISGGQTGADRGGLDAALEAGIPIGGFVPKGRIAEDGTVPELYTGMVETLSVSYPARTEANVLTADVTIVFTHGRLSGGSLKTVNLCSKHGKPTMHVDLSAANNPPSRVAAWLFFDNEFAERGGEVIVNIAGQRELKAHGIQGEVKAFMLDLFYEMEYL